MSVQTKVVKPLSQENVCLETEMRDLASTDFVLPLKEEGICLKAVIMQIFKFYNPRRLIIVSTPDVLDRISKLIQHWELSNNNCWKFFFVNELTLLDTVLGKQSINTLKSIYEEASKAYILDPPGHPASVVFSF